MNSAPKQTPKPAPDTLFKDRLAGTGQAEAASRQDRELRLEGRRLGRLRGGKIRITCGCGHSGDVPVAALVARHGDEVRVRDADGWESLGSVGQRIQGAHPDFDPRSYGCANLSTLVERSGGLDIRKDANNVHVRRKAAVARGSRAGSGRRVSDGTPA